MAVGVVHVQPVVQGPGEQRRYLASTSILLALVALAANVIPAIRAARMDPMQALYYE
ncbi:MAG TPA: hypothetical protein VEZ90_11935 [Blastocatellia bacterium]|nr:hypothetical protein [Blastocatellia bacterium]